MAADPAQADLTLDFALQLLLEGHHQSGVRPASPAVSPPASRDDAAAFDDLLALYLGQDAKALCNAAQYYVYYIVSVNAVPSEDREDWSSLTLAVASRLPWLVGSLRPGMLWESTAHSLAMDA